jgi:probable phosphoglycerate mutase
MAALIWWPMAAFRQALVYCHPGEAGGSPLDFREGRPGWDIFRDGCPNGESPDEIGARADRLIARLRELDDDVALSSVFVAR